MQIVSTLGIVIVSLSLAYYIYSYFCVGEFFSRKDESFGSPDFSLYPVSILKPLKKAFPGWKSNLETFCKQNYPEYEIVVGTSDVSDPALQQVIDELNWCPIRLAETTHNPGPNFKVGNLVSAASIARYDIFAISDADTRVSPKYLKNVVSTLLEKDVGLVTCLYKGVDCKTFPARLEALVVQTDFIPGVLVAEKSGAVKFAFGATIALRKSTLESIGGFEVLYPYLADDYQLGNRVARIGLKVMIADEIVEHVVGERRWADFFRQQLRWAVTCRVCQPVGYFFSVLSHGVSLATLNLFVNSHAKISFLLWVASLGIRYLTCFKVNSKYLKNQEVKSVLWILPFKDFFSTFIWAASFFVDKVYWAGNYFRVNRDGTMEPLK